MSENFFSYQRIKPAVMLQGTGSSVGKSLLVAGLCRWLQQQGIKVSPFKPQNMSNNAMVTIDHGEIGRAQALQATAAKIPASRHMNPILLKPLGLHQSQLVVTGQIVGNVSARAYYQQKPWLLKKILASYQTLEQTYDMVVIEGAGSPAETNLRNGDIANMGFAEIIKTPVVLVGDIDRGGVIASLVGTHAVLSESDRKLVKGYIINKFRGEVDLFHAAHTLITEKTHWQNLGVLPFLDGIEDLPQEDSLNLKQYDFATAGKEKTNVEKLAVLLVTPSLANFDDVAPLAAALRYLGGELRLLRAGEKIPEQAKLVLLGGSKNTLSDAEFVKNQSWEKDLKKLLADKNWQGMVLGICGGFQMLGQKIIDRFEMEQGGVVTGLGLIPMVTELQSEKTLLLSQGVEQLFGTKVTGYEIHLGQSVFLPTTQTQQQNFLQLTGANGKIKSEGYISADKKLVGTYLHGILNNHDFLVHLCKMLGWLPASGVLPRYEQKLDGWLDLLARTMEKNLRLDRILQFMRE